MAKKQLTSFSKLIISGSIAVILVSGVLTSIFASRQNQNLESQAYNPGRMGAIRPLPTPSIAPQCFEKVVLTVGGYYWPNACRGRSTMTMCAEVLSKLSDDEVVTYKRWVELGKPTIPGCAPTMTSRPVTKPVLTPYPGYIQQ